MDRWRPKNQKGLSKGHRLAGDLAARALNQALIKRPA